MNKHIILACVIVLDPSGVYGSDTVRIWRKNSYVVFRDSNCVHCIDSLVL